MSKLSLTDLANLQNEQTAVAALNANSAATEAALENTLSRDGSSPNFMNSVLDMNSNQIINLPAATTSNGPLRVQDLINFTNAGNLTINNFGIVEFDTRTAAIAATISPTQNSLKINGYSSAGDGGAALYKRVGSQPTHAGKFQSAGGIWWEIAENIINPFQFGAVGDGSTNDTVAVQNVIDYATSSTDIGVAKKVHFPGGHTFKVTNIILDGIVTLEGDGPHLSKILFFSGGSNIYGIASAEYVNNQAFASPPFTFRNLYFDGGGVKTNVVVHRNYESLIEDCYITNCVATTGTNLLYTSLAINGVTGGGGGGDNKFIRVYFGYGLNTAGYQVRVDTPTSFTMGDTTFDGCIFQGTVANANLHMTVTNGWAAGWIFVNNRLFGIGDGNNSSVCAVFNRTSISSHIANNIFAGSVKIIAGDTAGGRNHRFYDNTVHGFLEVDFAEAADGSPTDTQAVHSMNNNYSEETGGGYIINDGNSVNQKIISQNDHFYLSSGNIFRWLGGAANPSIIEAHNSYDNFNKKTLNGYSAGSITNNAFYDLAYIDNQPVIHNNAITVIRGIADTTALSKADGSFSFIAAGPTDVTVNPATTLVVTNAKAAALQDTNGVSYLSADTSGASLDGDTINLRNRAKTLNMLQLTATAANFNSASPPKLFGTTSGSTILKATAIAGATTVTLPAATDTLVGKATTDTFTNKTFDTAGTGNSFLINGTAVTADTGTGLVARQTSPSFVTPFLNVASATSINKVVITAPATAATLTILNNKTFTVNNTITLAGTDGQTYTLPTTTGSVMTADSTNTLTNKTYDTAGTGNSFSINGVTATGNTGTGLIARQNTPSFITPSLGDAIANTVNKVTLTTPASGSTLTILNGKTLTVNNSIALTGTDSAVYTFPTATATLPAYVASTWTPSFVGSTTAGTGQTYSTQSGTYEQIGRLVIARFALTATSLGTAAGNLFIGLTGLPAPATTSGEIGGGVVTFYAVTGLAANSYGLVVNVNGSSSTTTASVFQNNSTTNAFLTVTQAGGTASINGYFVYRV